MRSRRFRPPSRPRLFWLSLAGALALCITNPALALDPGDSNRDLRVSAPDLTALLRILAGDAPGNDGADANRDGFVLFDDLRATVARLFGRPLAEPTSTPTLEPTLTATGTATRSPTSTSSPTLAATGTATATASPSPSLVVTPTATPSASATSTGTVPTPTPSPTASGTSSPTASPTRTRTATPSATGTRASSPTVTPTVTPTARPAALNRCSDTLAVPLSIPDGVSAGTSNTFIVADDVRIEDLNVDVRIDHTYIGDLQVELTHVDTGTTVPLIDQAGNPLCAEENVSCTFDDQAARFVSSVCSTHDPALGGGIAPSGLLGDFAGESLAGTWRLDVADLAAQDEGQLVSWCLRANSTAPVITRLVCNDDTECTVALGEPFFVQFDFVDPDANAVSFVVTALNQAGQSFNIGSLPMFPPTGEDTYTLNLNQGFSCPTPPCGRSVFEFFVTVTDADGQVSPFASVLITVLGTP
jgi:subtilisin-like proprotein convertase family protein